MVLWNKVRKLFRLLTNDFKVCLHKHILISASINVGYDGKIFHSNWGDDLNYYFLKEISTFPIILTNETLFAKYIFHNYLVIGSTIAMLSNKKTVIWGAGLINKEIPDNMHICDIKAVRGPLTQVMLSQKGYSCPKCYGDPALLLPLHYKPLKKKIYDIGIIPHYNDTRLFKQFKNIATTHLIHTQGYDNWHEFIDEILQCKCIVSSSLHGLIISEAYEVPSHWIEFKNATSRDQFKYIDFYKSIGKEAKPLIIDENTSLATLIDICKKWQHGTINYKDLISSCPFPINITYENN